MYVESSKYLLLKKTPDIFSKGCSHCMMPWYIRASDTHASETHTHNSNINRCTTLSYGTVSMCQLGIVYLEKSSVQAMMLRKCQGTRCIWSLTGEYESNRWIWIQEANASNRWMNSTGEWIQQVNESNRWIWIQQVNVNSTSECEWMWIQ